MSYDVIEKLDNMTEPSTQYLCKEDRVKLYKLFKDKCINKEMNNNMIDNMVNTQVIQVKEIIDNKHDENGACNVLEI